MRQKQIVLRLVVDCDDELSRRDVARALRDQVEQWRLADDGVSINHVTKLEIDGGDYTDPGLA